jgi:hypothetical protein
MEDQRKTQEEIFVECAIIDYEFYIGMGHTIESALIALTTSYSDKTISKVKTIKHLN